MSLKYVVTGAFVIFVLEFAVAQHGSSAKDTIPATHDSLYIADYTGLLTTRLFLLFQNASLFINPGGEELSKISYRPNVNFRIGIAGFWKWFGLGLSLDNPFYKTDRAAYGKTTTVDIRINAYGRSVAGELFLQRYRGFYISSPEHADGTHFIIPDMQTFSIGLAGYWIMNSEKLSIRAAFIQNERQKKSAGSLVVRPAFLYFTISSNNGIIPAELVELYHLPAASRVTDGTFYSVELAPGYAYTLVFLRNFYATAALFPGVAAQFSSFTAGKEVYSDFEFTFQLSGRFALGYNASKWFLGGSVQTGFNELPGKIHHSLFSYDVAQFRIWGGTRFNLFKKKKVPVVY